MSKGYIMVARKIVDSGIFSKPPTWLKIFLFLLIEASHKDRGTLKRGQCFMTYKTICLSCKVTKSVVDHGIHWMKKQRMLATQKVIGGMIVTILKYATYQNPEYYTGDEEGETKGTAPPETGDTRGIQKGQHITRMKECNNEKNGRRTKRFKPPTLEEVRKYQSENPKLSNVDVDDFWKGFNDGGWIDTRGNPVRNWKLKLITWSSHARKQSGNGESTPTPTLFPPGQTPVELFYKANEQKRAAAEAERGKDVL